MHPMYRGGYMPGMYGHMPHNVNANLRKDQRGEKMSEERVEVKNIFQGGEGGGRGDGLGGLGAAAFAASLGNRNQGGGFCGPMGYGGFDGGFGGGGLIGALVLAGLVGGRGFGRDHDHGCDRPGPGPVIVNNIPRDNGHDHDNDCCDQIGQQVILSKLGSLEGAIPLAAANTTNAILSQTNELQGTLTTLALAAQNGFANVKDSVQIASGAQLVATGGVKDAIQNGLALTNTNLLTGLCSVRDAIGTDGDRTRALLVARFQQEDATKIAAQAAEIIELRNDRDNRSRHASLELQISNTNTAVAAQQQAQGQFQVQRQADDIAHLSRCVQALVGDIQAVRQGQVIFNSGTMAASGTQAAANTRVA